MDNNQFLPSQGFKFFSKRNIIVILIIIIVLELAWATWSYLKGSTNFNLGGKAQEKTTSISLVTPSSTYKVGEKVVVSINVSSPKKTAGTDLVIKYDPKILTAETSGAKKEVVVRGALYKDYAVNSLDPVSGIISVSGIADTNGVLADGIFGWVSFKAKAPGLAKITLEFNAGSTKDSNVIEAGTNADILGSVNNLELTITP